MNSGEMGMWHPFVLEDPKTWPEEDGEYLTSVVGLEGDEHLVVCLDYFSKELYFGDHWHVYGDDGEVYAWTELPEPFKVEVENV